MQTLFPGFRNSFHVWYRKFESVLYVANQHISSNASDNHNKLLHICCKHNVLPVYKILAATFQWMNENIEEPLHKEYVEDATGCRRLMKIDTTVLILNLLLSEIHTENNTPSMSITNNLIHFEVHTAVCSKVCQLHNVGNTPLGILPHDS